MRLPGLAAILCLLAAAFSRAAESDHEFFEKRIRPVLAEHCYKCHSAQSEKLKGGLLLDTQEGVARGGESGPAIVPGDPEASLLIKAIRWTDEDLQMPPKKKLSDAAIADLEAWVKMGAPDTRTSSNGPAQSASAAKDHWAFKPPQREPIPTVRNQSWPKTEIDRFILAKLEAANLEPSSPADRRTLLRRASYDLTGLPPTYDEVASFVNDGTPGAFERVIDRLLDSPRYGERWARHWLDVARFADTKGYVYSDREESQFVHSHVYRDWVIKAFNDDMPFDRFLVEQIAGDQLPHAEGLNSPLAAMGFLTVGRRFLGVTHDIIDDRIDTLTKATQALTVSCARCHDHKFDPIPIQDYYSLYGVFSASTERTTRLDSGEPDTKEYREFKKGYDERVRKLQETFEKRKEELLARVRLKTPEYLLAVLEADKLPTEEHYEIRGPDDLNPTIARQWQSYLFQTAKQFHPVWAPWHAFATAPKNNFAAEAEVAWEKLTSSSTSSNLNPLVRSAFAKNLPKSMQDVATAYATLLTEANRKHLEKSEMTPSELELQKVLYGADSPVSVPPGSVWDVEWFFHEAVRVEFGKLQSDIDRWIIKSPGAPRFAVALVDKPNQKNPRVFRRGNPANRGEEVPRRYLELLEGPDRKPFTHGSGRLELARAIASPDNPLTARVMVNRVWAHHFGEGLVRTLNDFGTRSEPPSHPELLDWLANYFVENGWSVKKLHRLLMLSSTYAQGTTPSSAAIASDPQNRLLSHMNRRRLEFEELRDSFLSATGELSTDSGGKPLPLFGAKLVARRAIYGFVDRQFLPGVYRVFDFPNPDLPSGQRSLTTVPQQALYLMNNRFLLDRARILATNTASLSPEMRVAQLYRTAFQRDASGQEADAALTFIRTAESIASPEPPPPPPPSAWSYGYGKIASGRTASFVPLPHFADNAWQGGPDYPDAKLGWVQLTPEGGHAGNDLDHAAIRRWTAPTSGEFQISGSIEHKRTEGDGIHASICSSRHGVLGEWNLHNIKTKTEFERIRVEKGDTVDFVVDIRGGLNNDDFTWVPIVKLVAESPAESGKTEWNAKKEFSGPVEIPPAPLKPWESLAHALLISNEFVFVD